MELQPNHFESKSKRWLLTWWGLPLAAFVLGVTLVGLDRASVIRLTYTEKLYYVEPLGWAMSVFILLALISSFRYVESRLKKIIISTLILFASLFILWQIADQIALEMGVGFL